jgi:hypothetical protein
MSQQVCSRPGSPSSNEQRNDALLDLSLGGRQCVVVGDLRRRAKTSRNSA